MLFLAHIAGIPVEETLMAAPPLSIGLTVLLARWRARRGDVEEEREREEPGSEPAGRA